MDVHPLPARALIAVGLLAACGDGEPEVYADLPSIEIAAFAVPQRHDLDLMFMIDDSTNYDMEINLAVAMPTLTARLMAMGVSSLHIGVATSDLGTTGSVNPDMPGPPVGQVGNGGCAGHGKDGVLQTSGAAVTGAFIIDEPGQRNYTGTLDEVLGTMVKVGSGGCGFEQPLAAIGRALTNPVNLGFRRADTDLAIVQLADEDDCSFLHPGLLDPAAAGLGPLQSFRCTRFGLRCDENLDELGEKHGCHADEESTVVTGVAGHIAALRAAAVRPPTFAAIVGPPSPVIVEQRTPPGGGTAVTSLAHACSYTGLGGLEVADPAVRVADVVRAMEGRGVLANVCVSDLRPALERIADTIGGAFGVVCLDTTMLRDSSFDPGIQPTCTAELDGVAVPFEIVADPAACVAVPDHLRLVVHPDAGATGTVRVRCEVPG
ncbi:MAG: hypothetical protein JNL83_25435 [Myxococcales bacterium]|nr:hypothetical protein [Myxococcales bacterium]